MLRFDFTFEVPGKGMMKAQGHFKEGLKLAILGPSGCGKSTFLKSLCGLIPRSSGYVKWKEDDLNTAILAEGVLGYSFQNSPLFPHLNVRDNLALPFKSLKTFKNFSESLQKERVDEMLSKANLLNLADRFPQNLSGGEKKRISLLRAMIFHPPFLVLDEPFSDLDAENRIVFKSWLENMIQEHKGILIYVTHSKEDLSLSNSEFTWPSNDDFLNFGKLPKLFSEDINI